MNKWISVEDRLPEVETEVLVIAVTQRGYRTVTLGMYEDGTMPEEKSLWNWDEISFNWDWDEELTRVLSRKVGGSLATITLRA